MKPFKVIRDDTKTRLHCARAIRWARNTKRPGHDTWSTLMRAAKVATAAGRLNAAATLEVLAFDQAGECP